MGNGSGAPFYGELAKKLELAAEELFEFSLLVVALLLLLGTARARNI